MESSSIRALQPIGKPGQHKGVGNARRDGLNITAMQEVEKSDVFSPSIMLTDTLGRLPGLPRINFFHRQIIHWAGFPKEVQMSRGKVFLPPPAIT
ncbi:MAG: hypothetical protein LBS77_01630 [Desulfovibrio sp.]|jgi:hypothetical protein|nr:hypothetical protein [Desulfovibrio sp.]